MIATHHLEKRDTADIFVLQRFRKDLARPEKSDLVPQPFLGPGRKGCFGAGNRHTIRKFKQAFVLGQLGVTK